MNVKEKTLVGGCAGEENGWNTQLLYFTGSSLSRDDKLLFMISDKGGSPNIVMRDLEKGTEKTLTQNSNGTRPADGRPVRVAQPADVGRARDAYPQHLRGERPRHTCEASSDGLWRRARSRGRRDAQERDVRRDNG